MTVRWTRRDTARALAARRRSAVETGTIAAELEAARLELARTAWWHWRRRGRLEGHVHALELLLSAYSRGGRDIIQAQRAAAQAMIRAGFHVPLNGRQVR